MAEARLEASKQTAFLKAFTDLARENKELISVISLDQAKYLVAQIVAAADPAAPFDVSALEQYLRESGAPAQSVHELMLGLKRRAENLGLSMALPPATAALPLAEQQRLAEVALGRSSDARKAASPPPPKPAPAEAKPPGGAANPGAAGGKKGGANRLLLGVLGLLGLVAVGVLVVPMLLPDRLMEARALLAAKGDPSRYTCTGLNILGTSIVCAIDFSLEAPPPPDHKTRLAKTRAVAKAAGFEDVRFVERLTLKPIPE